MTKFSKKELWAIYTGRGRIQLGNWRNIQRTDRLEDRKTREIYRKETEREIKKNRLNKQGQREKGK